MSTYDLLGFPSAVAVLLFSVGLTIALIPLFGGKTIAGLSIPEAGAGYPKGLQKYGWLTAVVAGLLFVPVWPPAPEADDPAKPFDVAVTLRSGTPTPLDCRRFADATVTLRVGARSYRASVDAACAAAFRGVAPEHRNQDARLGLEGARGFVLQTQAVPGLSATPFVAAVDNVGEVPRVRIAILPSEVQSSSAQLEEFRDALSFKIVSVSQLFAARGDAFGYVDLLKVVADGPSSPSAKDLRDFWEASHALELVRGQVVPGSQPPTIRSSIFLGDLAPTPELVSVPLSVQVTPSDFSRTHDTYSVVMLYALARDAQRLGKPSDVIAQFLSVAHGIGQQLDDPQGELTAIKAAIAAMLKDIQPQATSTP